MPYESVDALQLALTRDVFHYAKDAKKAAGRALGTLVEMITFYLVKSWGLERHTAIERRLPEYANADITHNVEFSLHPSREIVSVSMDLSDLPFTARKLIRSVAAADGQLPHAKGNQLLASDGTLRNACVICEDTGRMVVAYLGAPVADGYRIHVRELAAHPFAVLECKRVGVEQGTKKGPQTIEKAKQGAYVARSISSLQRVRMSDGAIYGLLDTGGPDLRCEPYHQLLEAVISSDDPALVRDFTLTVGVVSNHGNWFTCDDHNKELKVLAQSYDWLVFLTDAGLSAFVESLLLHPAEGHEPIRDAFVASYADDGGPNRFTKVQIALAADLALQDYFATRLPEVEGWFNVISPPGRSIAELRAQLEALCSKNWEEILS